MARFVLRRICISIPLLVAASFLVFTLVASAGDPLAGLRSLPDVPQEQIAARRHALHLDEPVVYRYAIWAMHVVRGDFGTSVGGVEVRPLVWRRLQVTVRLVAVAVAIALAASIGLGVSGAARRGSLFDSSTRLVTYSFLALPVFWVAGVLKEFGAIRLNNLVGRQVVFTIGEADRGLTGGLAHRLTNYAGHLALPTVALALVPIAVWSRYLRASMLDALSSGYVQAALAKGLSRSQALLRHALPNALVPLTTVVALDLGRIVGGSVIVERVFAWQGMGSLLLDGVRDGDTNVVLAWLMVAATAVLACNLLADIACAWLDPRVRRD